MVLAVSQLGLRTFSRNRFRGRAYLEESTIIIVYWLICSFKRESRLLTWVFAKTKGRLCGLQCWLLCICINFDIILSQHIFQTTVSQRNHNLFHKIAKLVHRCVLLLKILIHLWERRQLSMDHEDHPLQTWDEKFVKSVWGTKWTSAIQVVESKTCSGFFHAKIWRKGFCAKNSFHTARTQGVFQTNCQNISLVPSPFKWAKYQIPNKWPDG